MTPLWGVSPPPAVPLLFPLQAMFLQHMSKSLCQLDPVLILVHRFSHSLLPPILLLSGCLRPHTPVPFSLLFLLCHSDGDIQIHLDGKQRCKQQPRPGIGHPCHRTIESAYRLVDFLLTVGVVVAGVITADGLSLLAQSADLSAQASSVHGKEPFQFSTRYGSFFSRKILSQIGTDGSSFPWSFQSLGFTGRTHHTSLRHIPPTAYTVIAHTHTTYLPSCLLAHRAPRSF